MSDKLDRSIREQPRTGPCCPCPTSEVLANESFEESKSQKGGCHTIKPAGPVTAADKYAYYGEIDGTTTTDTTTKFSRTEITEKKVGGCQSTTLDRATIDIKVKECTAEFDAGKTAQEKLCAIDKMAGMGVTTFTAKDERGKQRDYSIEIQQVEGRTLVHCYSRDESGTRRIVLRGLVDDCGQFGQQRDQYGNEVSYWGDWWSVNMRGEAPPRRTIPQSYREHSESRSSRSREEHSESRSRSREYEHEKSSRYSSRSESSSRRVYREEHEYEKRGRSESRYVEHEERRGGINLGKVLGTIVTFGAPILLNKMMRDDCNDRYYDSYDRYLHSYDKYARNQGGYRHDFYSGNHGYSGYQGGWGQWGGSQWGGGQWGNGGHCHDDSRNYYQHNSGRGGFSFFGGRSHGHGHDHDNHNWQKYNKSRSKGRR